MDKTKLISAIYSAALAPDDFDEIVKELDEAIFGVRVTRRDGISGSLENPGSNFRHRVDPEIVTHIQQAEKIQKRMGRGGGKTSKLEMLLEAAPNPSWVFDGFGCVLAANALANNLSSTNLRYLKGVCKDLNAFKKITSFIATSKGPELLIVPDYFDKQTNKNSCAVVRRLGACDVGGLVASDGSQDGIFLFTLSDFEFDLKTTRIFSDNYNLTAAEMSVTTRLSRGEQIAQIAQHRDVSIATVRTQIKTIKRKTKTSDIASIVRLFCGFSTGIVTTSQLVVLGNEPVSKLVGSQTKLLKLRDGRDLFYNDQGDPNGAPVLMVHNMPYGMAITQTAAAGALRMGLRIITPIRPGYGDSSLIRGVNGNELLDTVAKDFNQLLVHLDIPAAVVVGQSMGANFALRFARLFPNRVTGLLGISRGAMWRDEWLMLTPVGQRFAMRIARYIPQLLPVLVRAIVSYIDDGKVKNLIRTLTKSSPVEAKAFENNPEILEIIVKDILFGFKQGGDAFCCDCLLTIEDFTQDAKLSPHKFHILHGEKDGVVDIVQSQSFVDEVPGSTIEVLKDAGHFLFYSHWEEVFSAIKRKTSSK